MGRAGGGGVPVLPPLIQILRRDARVPRYDGFQRVQPMVVIGALYPRVDLGGEAICPVLPAKNPLRVQMDHHCKSLCLPRLFEHGGGLWAMVGVNNQRGAHVVLGLR